MKIVAVIPCRYGSKRFEGKPLSMILGKPMVWWVYSSVRNADILSDVAVATDDERIYQCVKDFGGRVVMTEPFHRSGTDRVTEAARKLNLEDRDIVINIQGDQPVFDFRCLPEVVDPLLKDEDLDMSTLACKMVDQDEITDPNHVKVIFDQNRYALYFSRSPIPFGRDSSAKFDYFKHLGIYAYRKRFLERFVKLPEGRLEGIEKLEQLRALEYGCRIKVVETVHESMAVDTPDDIARVEAVLRSQQR
jgi:3-deoxy-manno-octulosonate cytidylyltransferase (CMP-KDO synthetase)